MKKITLLMFGWIFALFFVACSGIEKSSYDIDKTDNPYLNVKVGDVIQLGGEYDWRVLEIQDGKALILSEKILIKRAYHTETENITWEECELRQYLNGSFYNNTFTTEEKELIIETKILNNDNPWYGTEGGINTVDKIFLLSINEIIQCFGDSGKLENRPNDNTFYIDDQYNSIRVAEDKDTNVVSWWWLRSPGLMNERAAYINIIC